jgi:hypothetical protein
MSKKLIGKMKQKARKVKNNLNWKKHKILNTEAYQDAKLQTKVMWDRNIRQGIIVPTGTFRDGEPQFKVDSRKVVERYIKDGYLEMKDGYTVDDMTESDCIECIKRGVHNQIGDII